MDKDDRDKLAKRARDYGFDSLQAYIRFWAKADVDGRQFDLDAGNWQPSPAEIRRLDKLAEEAIRDSKAGKLKSFDNPGDALAYLHSL